MPSTSSHEQEPKLHVLVVFGGRSGEHEVSLSSARAVVDALDPAKYDVTLLGISKAGHWLLPGGEARALLEGISPEENIPALLPQDGSTRALRRLCGERIEEQGAIDVVFPVLHGPYGEDGTVQGLLELAGLPYVGAGVTGSAVAMDKVIMKDLFRAHGLPTPAYRPVTQQQWRDSPDAVLKTLEDELGLPCFVKPANLGSSVGISKAHTREALTPALELALSYDLKAIVEAAVPDAREIECSVLGNEEPEASVLGEVVPSREFYSYEAKYIDDASDIIIPAQLPPELADEMRALAVAAFRALDLAGMARADFLLERDTLRFYLSELNTIPGFTPISMYPKLWLASGLTYPQLIDRLIQLALDRHQRRSQLRTTYTPEDDAQSALDQESPCRAGTRAPPLLAEGDDRA